MKKNVNNKKIIDSRKINSWFFSLIYFYNFDDTLGYFFLDILLYIKFILLLLFYVCFTIILIYNINTIYKILYNNKKFENKFIDKNNNNSKNVVNNFNSMDPEDPKDPKEKKKWYEKSKVWLGIGLGIAVVCIVGIIYIYSGDNNGPIDSQDINFVDYKHVYSDTKEIDLIIKNATNIAELSSIGVGIYTLNEVQNMEAQIPFIDWTNSSIEEQIMYIDNYNIIKPSWESVEHDCMMFEFFEYYINKFADENTYIDRIELDLLLSQMYEYDAIPLDFKEYILNAYDTAPNEHIFIDLLTTIWGYFCL